MTTIPDETLMAFADGELDAFETARIEGILRTDAELRQRLARLRATDEILRAAVSAPLAATERLSALLEPELKQHGDADQVMPLRRKHALTLREWLPAGVGVAAALLLVIMSGAMSPQKVSWLEQVNDGIALADPVLSMISSTPSGQVVQSNGLHVKPIVSFVSKDGRMCREAHVQDAEMAVRVLACRDNHVEVAHLNEWCIEAIARVQPIANRQSYHTAGVATDPVIDAAYERLGRREVLDQAGETLAIGNGWKAR
jgi:hypothetical protein